MRDIQFRAWQNNQMFYEVQAGGFKKTVPSIYVERNGVCEWVNASPGVEIMQFTGLKDKNGKEIYEGDIVKLDVGENAHIQWNGLEASFIAFQRSSSMNIVTFINMKNCHMFEVIGNVCESPKLLLENQ